MRYEWWGMSWNCRNLFFWENMIRTRFSSLEDESVFSLFWESCQTFILNLCLCVFVMNSCHKLVTNSLHFCVIYSSLLFCDSAHKGSTWAPEDIFLCPCVSCPCHLIRFCQISPLVLFLIYVDDWYQFRKFPLWPGPVGLLLSIQGEVWAQSVWLMMAGCSRKKGPHLAAKRPLCPWPCSGVEIYIFPKIIWWNRLHKWLHIFDIDP